MRDQLDIEWSKWACETMISLLRIQQHATDPDAIVADWFEEASEDDEEHLIWAMAMWKTIRHMNSQELERALAAAREKFQLLDSLGET